MQANTGSDRLTPDIGHNTDSDAVVQRPKLFTSQIATYIEALKNGSVLRDGSQISSRSPENIIQRAQNSGHLNEEAATDLQGSILRHRAPLPLLHVIDELLTKEAERKIQLREIEERLGRFNKSVSDRTLTCVALATRESAEEFQKALDKERKRLVILEAPSLGELKLMLWNDITGDSTSISDNHATLISEYSGKYYQRFTTNLDNAYSVQADVALTTLEQVGWIDNEDRKQAELALLRSTGPAWHALAGLHYLAEELQRRCNHANKLATSAEKLGLEKPQHILDLVHPLACADKETFNSHYSFREHVKWFQEKIKSMESLDSQVVVRWIPRDELMEIRKLPESKRIEEANAIYEQCSFLQKIDTLDELFRSILEDTSKLNEVDPTSAHKHNTHLLKLLQEKPKQLEIPGPYTKDVRSEIEQFLKNALELKDETSRSLRRYEEAQQKLREDAYWSAGPYNW